MKKFLLCIAVAMASILVPSQTRAQNCMPMEVVVGEADCIVVGEVTAIGKPTELELDTSDFPTPHKGWYHTVTVKVARQILPAPPAAEKSSKGEVIEVLTICADPNSKPAGLMRNPSDAPVPTLKMETAQSAAQGGYHSALVGDSYLMILSKLSGRGEYYL